MCGRSGPLHRWRIEYPLTVPRPIQQWWTTPENYWHFMGDVEWTLDGMYEPHIWGYRGAAIRADRLQQGKGKGKIRKGKGKGKGKGRKGKGQGKGKPPKGADL